MGANLLPKPLKLGQFFDFDETNGEIRIFGKRRVTVDVEGLCAYLDNLVGKQVAGTILTNYGRQSGRNRVTELRKMKTNPEPPTIGEIVEELIAGEILAGYGVVKLIFREDEAVPVELEMRNSIIKAATGTVVRFVLSYWAGALGALLNKTMDVTNVTYDADILKCQFTVI